MPKAVNKIDKNVPLPNWHRRGRWIEVLLNMKSGDSILVGSRNEADAIRIAGLKMGVKMSIRKTIQGLRAWRLT